jgi:hypothetical protein
MSRPVGVTASAVVAIVGSILALVFASLAVASLFIETTQPQPPNAASFVVAGALMFVAFACIGFWTSLGLFRLRPWARTATLVFAGFLAGGSIFILLMTLAVPMPPSMDAGTQHTVRGLMVGMFGIPFVIAIWWLIQFNTQSTKAAFASSIDGSASPRPMSITIIACACIFGGVSCLFAILARAPAFVFGASFNGWAAGVIYAIFAAVSLFIGKGLLDLREEARILAIGWSAFWLVHGSAVTLVPSLRQRMFELQRAMVPNQQTPTPFDEGMLMNVSFAVTVIVIAVAIWFLIRNRAAFVGAENPQGIGLG